MTPTEPVLLGPCEPYAEVEHLPEGCPCRSLTSGDEDPTEDQLTDLLAQASMIVWALLGRQNIGLCEVTIHPCRQATRLRCSSLLAGPHGIGNHCGCRSASVLLEGPVYDVASVVVAGEELDPGDYYLRDGQWLERVEGGWPAGGSDPDDFAITYVRGTPVDGLVRDATIEVANALWTERCGQLSCLPGKAVTSMNQAGTSYNYEADAERVKAAGEALATTWKAIGVYNPTQAYVPSFVWSPDEPYRNHTIRTFT